MQMNAYHWTAETVVKASSTLDGNPHSAIAQAHNDAIDAAIRSEREPFLTTEDSYEPLDYQRDVTELLRMYLGWKPNDESLQFRLYNVVSQLNRAQLLNKKAALALSVARNHVRGNINRSGGAWSKELWGEDERLILDTYDELIGYKE